MEGSLFEDIFKFIVDLISKTGYLGVFLATALEYACFPIPSEIILPFIGYLASIKVISLTGGIVISSIAGIVGSLICYYVGYFGGKPMVEYIEKKFKSSKKPMNSAKKWFQKYDTKSILLARLLPVARTYISIPAGIAKMNIALFTLYSSIGIIIWNTILICFGYYLGANWKMVEHFMNEYTKAAEIIIVLALCIILYFKFFKKRKKTKRLSSK